MKKLFNFMHRNIKMAVSLAVIVIVFIAAASLIFFAGPRSSHAFVTRGGDCLEVTTSDEFVDVSNLNPGDEKSSYLIAKNVGEGPLEYFFDMRKVASLKGLYRDLVGKSLDKGMVITISLEGDIMFQGLLADFEELYMGTLMPEEEHSIGVRVELSGPDIGNEYQGSSVTVRFMFRSECTGDTGDETGSITIRKELEFDLPESMPKDQKDAIIEEAMLETFWINVKGPGGYDETHPVTAGDDPPLLLPFMEYGDYEVAEVEPMPPLYIRLGIHNQQFTLGKENRDVVVTVGNRVRVEDYEDPGTGTVLIRKRVLSSTDEDKAVAFTIKISGDGDFEERVEIAEKDGWVALELDEGTYQFSEIDIPEGYKLLRISSSSITVTEDSEHQITVTNYTGELPPTGGLLSMLGLGALLLGAKLLRRRK